jgi:hypothetical protein
MPILIEPVPHFTQLSEEVVREALRDPNPGNAIAQEVARLIGGYTENFRAHCERLGRIPADILHVAPASPIEGVAMELTTQAIAEAMQQRPRR